MAFGAIFKKDTQKPGQSANSMQPAPQAQKAAEKQPLEMPDFESDFENAIDSPEKLLADDGEVFEPPESAPQAQQAMPQKAAQRPAQPPPQQPAQKIPAFVSLDKYKEIRFSLRDIKITSAGLRKTLESLRQNRDGGTELLNNTIDGLERIEGNLDKIRTVLRT